MTVKLEDLIVELKRRGFKKGKMWNASKPISDLKCQNWLKPLKKGGRLHIRIPGNFSKCKEIKVHIDKVNPDDLESDLKHLSTDMTFKKPVDKTIKIDESFLKHSSKKRGKSKGFNKYKNNDLFSESERENSERL